MARTARLSGDLIEEKERPIFTRIAVVLTEFADTDGVPALQ